MKNINKLWMSVGFVLMGIMLISFVSAGEGGSAVPITSISLTEQGNAYNMKPGRLTFEFNEQLYAIQIRRINSDSVDFLIMTLDMNKLEDITAYTLDDSFSLKSGEKREIDIDKNGVMDIVLELENTGKIDKIKLASFSIQRINIKQSEISDKNITTDREIIPYGITGSVIQKPISESVSLLNLESKEQPTFLKKIVDWFEGLFG